jgi:hypothetical protein
MCFSHKEPIKNIEFLQYPDFFAYDTIKAGSLRRYFDRLTVLHIASR